MTIKAKRLTVIVGETMRWKRLSLYQALFLKMKDAGLAGVTVIRGVEGYGQLKVIHTTRLLELSSDLPMVIECVDMAENIYAIIPEISEMVTRGLISVSDVDVYKWSN